MPHAKFTLEYDPELASLIENGDKDKLTSFWLENYDIPEYLEGVLRAKTKIGAKTCRCGKRPTCWVFTYSLSRHSSLDNGKRMVGPYCNKCCKDIEFEPSSH